MVKALGYIVSINPPEGLDQLAASEVITTNFDEKLAELERAGVLEGITIHTKMQLASMLCIDGPTEKIQRLKQHLENSNIGTLCENGGSQASPIVPSAERQQG